jgi:AraC-like DNA-binding protein
MANRDCWNTEKYAQDFLAEMDRNDEHTRAVTKIILSKLDDEALSINKVAREMAVSVRTLQKRLEDEGVVFSDLYKGIRHRLAQKYLRENYTVEQITYLLGFLNQAFFARRSKSGRGHTAGISGANFFFHDSVDRASRNASMPFNL